MDVTDSKRRIRHIGIACGVAVVATALATQGNERLAQTVLWGLSMALVAVTPFAIPVEPRVRHGHVRTITGALCVYLLIGMFFAAVVRH